jgi:hypothetical protein
MFGARGLIFAAVILLGYFYFLNSEHKDRALQSFARLTNVPDIARPVHISQKDFSSKSNPQIHAPTASIPAPTSLDKAAIHLPANDVPEPADLPASQLMKFATGRVIQQEQGTFELLRLRAISKYSYTSDMGNFVDEKMKLVFFDPAAGATASLPMTFPVVVKSSNGQIGIISGTLLVSMRDIQQASDLAQRYGLALKAQDDSLSLAYMGVPRADQVNELMVQIRQEPSVKSVSAEIVQNWKKR